MKRTIQRLFLQLLYLTPIGYFLSLVDLFSGERTPGVYIQLSRDEPIMAFVKNNPTPGDRINWFINGGALLTQSYLVIYYNLGDRWGSYFAAIVSIFGAVNLISALFPKYNWNGKLPLIRITAVEVLVFTSLLISVL